MSVNEHGGPFEPYKPTPLADTLNRFLRPAIVISLLVSGVVFLNALGLTLIWHYVRSGNLDWPGVTAFCTTVLIPVIQWVAQRHDLKVRGLA